MKVKTHLDGYQPPDEVPPGTYDAKIVAVTNEMASTGTEFLTIDCELVGPTEVGHHVWGNIFLTQPARWKTAALLTAVGLPLTDQLETDDLIGKKLRIVVKPLKSQYGTITSEIVNFRKPLREEFAS